MSRRPRKSYRHVSMHHVWVDYPKLCVAKADSYDEAVHYAWQYIDEGKVTIRLRNKILLTLVKAPKLAVAAPSPEAIHIPPKGLDLMALPPLKITAYKRIPSDD